MTEEAAQSIDVDAEINNILENWSGIARVVGVHRTRCEEDGHLMNELGDLVRNYVNVRREAPDLSSKFAELSDEQILGEAPISADLKGGLMALGMSFCCMGSTCFELMKAFEEQEEEFKGVLKL